MCSKKTRCAVLLGNVFRSVHCRKKGVTGFLRLGTPIQNVTKGGRYQMRSASLLGIGASEVYIAPAAPKQDGVLDALAGTYTGLWGWKYNVFAGWPFSTSTRSYVKKQDACTIL
eukprot:3600177-Rhodomonas_salina.1